MNRAATEKKKWLEKETCTVKSDREIMQSILQPVSTIDESLAVNIGLLQFPMTGILTLA